MNPDAAKRDAASIDAGAPDGGLPAVAMPDVGLPKGGIPGEVPPEHAPDIARELGLQPHPEGGWYKETWRSDLSFAPEGYDGPRRCATAIYYLLNPGERSCWHLVRSDEIWLWHNGGPLAMRLGGIGETPDEMGSVHFTVGGDVLAGQHPQLVVPGGVWQCAEPAGSEPVLVSCLVAPGFDFADFRMA